MLPVKLFSQHSCSLYQVFQVVYTFFYLIFYSWRLFERLKDEKKKRRKQNKGQRKHGSESPATLWSENRSVVVLLISDSESCLFPDEVKLICCRACGTTLLIWRHLVTVTSTFPCSKLWWPKLEFSLKSCVTFFIQRKLGKAYLVYVYSSRGQYMPHRLLVWPAFLIKHLPKQVLIHACLLWNVLIA